MWYEMAVIAAHPADKVKDTVGVYDLHTSLRHSLQSILNAPKVVGVHIAQPAQSYEVSGRHAWKRHLG